MVKKIFGNLLLQMGGNFVSSSFFFVEAGKFRVLRNKRYALPILIKAKVYKNNKV